MTDATKINPKHYECGNFSAIEFCQAMLSTEEFRGYLKGCMFKYLVRAGRKEGEPAEDDYAKAAWFKERLEHYYGEDDVYL